MEEEDKEGEEEEDKEVVEEEKDIRSGDGWSRGDVERRGLRNQWRRRGTELVEGKEEEEKKEE